jgi:hypothetical protein
LAYGSGFQFHVIHPQVFSELPDMLYLMLVGFQEEKLKDDPGFLYPAHQTRNKITREKFTKV